MSDYFDALETELRAAVPRVRRGAPRDRLRIDQRAPHGRITLALGAAVPLAMLALVVVLITSRPQPRPAMHATDTSSTLHPASVPARVPADFRRFAAQLAVLRRPQTALDRTLPTRFRHALASEPNDGELRGLLGGSVASLTRETGTLPGGRTTYIVAYRHVASQGNPDDLRAGLRFFVIGSPPPGGPVLVLGSSVPDPAAFSVAAKGPLCAPGILWNIVPDRVARVGWQFVHGNRETNRLLKPHDNIVDLSLPAGAPCVKPTRVWLYGADGKILNRRG